MSMDGGGGVRAARNVSAAAVALIAAWSSYWHMVHVALGCAERPEVAYALPVSVDGMLVVATVVMVDDKRRTHRVRPIARLAFTAGVLASIAANIAAAHPSLGARVVDAWPALALLLVVEMLARPPVSAAVEVPPSHTAGAAAMAQLPVQPPHAPVPAELSRPQLPAAGGGRYAAQGHCQPPVPDADTRAPHRTGLASDSPAVSGVAEPPPPAPHTAAVRPAHPQQRVAERRRRPTATTRQLAQQIIAAEPDLSRREVAARLGVSDRRLREVLAYSG
jgi:hypothetical protein